MTGIYQDSYIYAYIEPYIHSNVSGSRIKYNYDHLVVRNISNVTVYVILLHRDELRDANEYPLRDQIREESFILDPGREYICNNYIGKHSYERDTHYITTAYRIIRVAPKQSPSGYSNQYQQPQPEPKPRVQPKPEPKPEPEPKPMTLPTAQRFLGYITLNNKEIPVSFDLNFNLKTGSTKYSNGKLPLTISDIKSFPNLVTFVLTETNPKKNYIPNNKLGGNITAIYTCHLYYNGTLDGHGTNYKGQIFNFELH